jgi:hypothetical protein
MQEPTMAGAAISVTSEAEARATARRLWTRLEAVHVLVYFAPEVRQAHAEAGLDTPMLSYVASRLGPLGEVGPELATAVLYGFAPRVVASAVPEVWRRVSPAEAIEVTQGALQRVLEPLTEGLEDDLSRAAEIARQAASFHPTIGRPLAAARTSLPWPEDPALILWEAATRIRESRGDGHVACLVEADLDGPASHLSVRGDGEKVRKRYGALRGWTDAEWDASARSLRERGLLDDDGTLTEAGRQLRDHLEARTDALAAAPWVALGAPIAEQLRRTMGPLVRRIIAADVLPGAVARHLNDPSDPAGEAAS